MRGLTRVQVRSIDARCIDEYKIPGLLLMENAGLNLARATLRILAELSAPADAAVTIVCGSGNNGGDGLVLARHLHNAGARPLVLYLGPVYPRPEKSDAAVNFAIAEAMGIVIQSAPDAATLKKGLAEPNALIVDAFLGTGPSSTLKPAAVSYVQAINEARGFVLAVDIPSGLDCDRGTPLGAAVRARRTVTMAATKIGFEAEGAYQYTGTVEVVDIGAPRQLLEAISKGQSA